jgi:hypothetical protein
MLHQSQIYRLVFWNYSAYHRSFTLNWLEIIESQNHFSEWTDMIIIIDFFSAEIDVHVSDLSLAVGKFNEANQRDKKIGKTAVLTKSTALTFLGETLKSLSLDTINNFGIFHTKKDVIIWLGLPEEDVLRYWAETINRA